MSTYAIKIDNDTHGEYVSRGEVRGVLETYRRENPTDQAFTRVSVWEMPPKATVGAELSVWGFVDES